MRPSWGNVIHGCSVAKAARDGQVILATKLEEVDKKQPRLPQEILNSAASIGCTLFLCRVKDAILDQ